jgi:hypothetical protein
MSLLLIQSLKLFLIIIVFLLLNQKWTIRILNLSFIVIYVIEYPNIVAYLLLLIIFLRSQLSRLCCKLLINRISNVSIELPYCCSSTVLCHFHNTFVVLFLIIIVIANEQFRSSKLFIVRVFAHLTISSQSRGAQSLNKSTIWSKILVIITWKTTIGQFNEGIGGLLRERGWIFLTQYIVGRSQIPRMLREVAW